MHEYSIIAALVDRVEREAQGRPGAVVRKLHVRIGEARRPEAAGAPHAHAYGA